MMPNVAVDGTLIFFFLLKASVSDVFVICMFYTCPVTFNKCNIYGNTTDHSCICHYCTLALPVCGASDLSLLFSSLELLLGSNVVKYYLGLDFFY